MRSRARVHTDPVLCGHSVAAGSNRVAVPHTSHVGTVSMWLRMEKWLMHSGASPCLVYGNPDYSHSVSLSGGDERPVKTLRFEFPSTWQPTGMK
jgi:hypothetical protein